ncbi:MAG: hypothetical protein K0Q79_1420 [Flavipsychrobacter sp.]|nr:hypothetical protein [Flavipsychrobacter sp.]
MVAGFVVAGGHGPFVVGVAAVVVFGYPCFSVAAGDHALLAVASAFQHSFVVAALVPSAGAVGYRVAAVPAFRAPSAAAFAFQHFVVAAGDHDLPVVAFAFPRSSVAAGDHDLPVAAFDSHAAAVPACHAPFVAGVAGYHVAAVPAFHGPFAAGVAGYHVAAVLAYHGRFAAGVAGYHAAVVPACHG